MKKHFFYLFAIFLFAAAGFLFIQRQSSFVQADSSDNVSGFAWSETIGWISFNCTNTSTCSQSNYGVNVDQAGKFTGYAWSEHIGWIRLDPAGPYPSQPNNSARLSVGNNQVTGWARACAGAQDPVNCSGGANPQSGGWDGWIKLRKHSSDGGGTPDYGVFYNPADKQFHGWAWGSDVTGWISFSCVEGGDGGANVCGQSNYKVSFNGLNQPPIAAISCTPLSCTGYTGDIFTLNNDSTDPNGSADIVSSEWDIQGWSSNPDLACPPNSPNLCNYTVLAQSLGAGTYQASLKVTDSFGASSQTVTPLSFTIKQDAVANFQCSLDQSTWQDCTLVKPAVGEVVYFQDRSTPSEGASLTAWSWVFPDGSPASSSSQNPSTSFQGSGVKQVSLSVTDSAGRQDTKEVNVTISIPFPDFIEISPF